MLRTKLFKHKHVHVIKNDVKVGSMLCSIIVQPHVVYCSVCQAVDGTHFGRNLKSGLAYRG